MKLPTVDSDSILNMPIIHQDTLRELREKDFIGFTFLNNLNGDKHRAEVIKVIQDIDEQAERYLVRLGDQQEAVVAYNELINAFCDQLEGDDEDGNLRTYQKIMDHRVNTESKVQEVNVLWDDGSETWEPLSMTAKQDPMTLAQ